MYELGIDLGTTYTAAAVRRGDQVDIAPLGTRGPVIPSVVLLGEGDTVLLGEAAQRRALTDPTRVAREFKRRIGDPLPIIVNGEPHSAESLSALLLKAVVAEVTKLEGAPPNRVALTHPANWGDYKKDLYKQAVRLADLPDVVYLTEPEAAAIHYASQERVETGAVVAVYDLGGGTFDATVLRKTDVGFEVLGRPEGIERLGGIDFDQAVFTHVSTALDLDLQGLDRSDPAVLSGMARLRQDCIEAKEALSVDTEASIPVALPGLHSEVRITRPELEAMVRRPISDTVAALRRGLRDAGVEPSELSTVLLVGGSSRIPMVAEMVGADLGRPVAVDTHPKYAIAMGAARWAGLAPRRDDVKLAAGPVSTSDAALPTAAPEAAAPTAPPEAAAPTAAEAGAAPPPSAAPAPPQPSPPVAANPTPPAPEVPHATPPDGPATPNAEAARLSVAPPAPTAAEPNDRSGSNNVVKYAVAAAVAVIAIVGGIITLGGGGGGDGGGNEAAAAEADADGCPDDGPFVCITDATAGDGQIRASFQRVEVDLVETGAEFFIESSPQSAVDWSRNDPFATSVSSDVPSGARLCVLLVSNGQQVSGTGNCVTIDAG